MREEGKMNERILRKGLVIGIIVLFIGIAFAPSFNAVSINEETVSTIAEPGPDLAFLLGRIENLYEDDYEKTFNAVNLRIISFLPSFGFYHLNPGEKISILCFAPGGFLFFGILTNNFIFAFCEVDSW